MPSPRQEKVLLVVALLLPTVVTLAYFKLVASASPAVQQGVYGVGKAVQFLLPVVWVFGVLRRRPRWSWGSGGDALVGVLFGVAVLLVTWFGYSGLAGAEFMADATTQVREKVASLGIDRPLAFALVGTFYAAVHSLLEEYYWRWFVFGRLRDHLPLGWAVAVSSVGFMLHHVLVLATYFSHVPLVAVLLSLCVAVGGGFWAWLYHRSRSLLGPWLGHLLVDTAIFAVGYRIVFAG
ncbi:CAAX amino terminal protease self- immunity [Posidoniimonas polymericola]|uniref:CAAX amino terminal protease self-immunity n=1 Tax=Posidoniimonas polymericola TaxID=2528002 RepID=A0A5C5XYT2_9BACT|nr:CPBP family intramembrane glutamic endopeptidase [Posidoniimonas polymericola]TWT67701.1 CAAX amino terminal protease self- immunity [Posidoniimonas polymericola]